MLLIRAFPFFEDIVLYAVYYTREKNSIPRIHPQVSAQRHLPEESRRYL